MIRAFLVHIENDALCTPTAFVKHGGDAGEECQIGQR